jgi:ABC-2 type transport system permease protein
MQGLYAVYRKEMGHYFVSPVAYVVVGVFLLLCALFFNYFVSAVVMQAAQSQMQGMSSPIDMPGEVMTAFFGLLSTLILFVTPMLTMGVYAEERKRGTMELLMTSPITEVQIVLGKFFAALTLFAAMLLPTIAAVIFLYVCSDPHLSIRVVLAGYLGVILLGGSLLALGTFVSSLTENQLIAVVLAFAASLGVWVIDLVVSNATGAVASVLQYLSVIHHYEDFTHGVIDTTALIYYISFILFFVFLTVRSVDSMRWRRA